MKLGTKMLLWITAVLIAMSSPAAALSEQEGKAKRKLPEYVDTSRKIELTGFFVFQTKGLNFSFIEGGIDEVTNSDVSRRSAELMLSIYFNRRKRLGVEFTLGYTLARGIFQRPIDFTDPDNPVLFDVENLDHNTISYQGNIIYNLGSLDLIPFVTIGGGFTSFSPRDNSSFPLENSYPNISLGVGVKYFLKEWFGIRAQVSDYYYILDEADGAVKDINQVRLHIGGVITF